MASVAQEPVASQVDAQQSVMTPPHSDEGCHKPDADLSSLDLNDDEDEEDILPDHYWDNGKIPVFKPTMDQFRSFKTFISKIDKYGMKSGIVKVIPPKEWLDSLAALDEAVKSIKVKNPITQEISGKSGTYTQANIEKQRSYNLPQWKALTEETQHQPPAKRGERRRAVPITRTPRPRQSSSKAAATTASPVSNANSTPGAPLPKRRGRPPKRRPSVRQQEPTPSVEGENASDSDHGIARPPTPTSPGMPLESPPKKARKARAAGSSTKGSQAKSVSERRKYNQVEVMEEIDEEAFKGFDYRFYGSDEFVPERCKELEALYWKTLTYAAPMYGADMPGSLFADSTSSWNVAKLENLLDVLGTKVPGVNTAYLYLGMWKATFAWHLEDVDLYSINYIHFGAPKQWYSISQEDARRFENAMKSLWPNDYKNCSQFLRHKTYLVSPTLLQEQFNIKVNRLVHYEKEFVITYPYGYHSGYNLGYNCAESVNFATEDWIEYGKIAKKCDCEADSVWVDANYIERKLKGEPSPEFFEETDEEYLSDEETMIPHSQTTLSKHKTSRKRKRDLQKHPIDASKKKRRVKIKVKTAGFEPCALCPNQFSSDKILPTDDGRHAHSICALYTPETYIWPEGLPGSEDSQTVYGVTSVGKERLGLRCYYCNSKKGACFQCSAKKCTRAYHATCAAAAGVRVDSGRTPFFVEGGDEYYIEDNDFRCRFHRTKRHKQTTGESLERDPLIKAKAIHIKPKSVVQAQYLHGDIFAGVVVENRHSEQAIVIDILPEGGDRIEVEYKWILVPNPEDSQLLSPSSSCLGPLPEQFSRATTHNRNDEYGQPSADDPFTEGSSLKWAEFHTLQAHQQRTMRKAGRTRVVLDGSGIPWHYVGEISTEHRASFTADVNDRRHDPASNFLETVKPRFLTTARPSSHTTMAPVGGVATMKVDLGTVNAPPLSGTMQERSAAITSMESERQCQTTGQPLLESKMNSNLVSAPPVSKAQGRVRQFASDMQVSRVPEWLLQTQQSFHRPTPTYSITPSLSAVSLETAHRPETDSRQLSGYNPILAEHQQYGGTSLRDQVVSHGNLPEVRHDVSRIKHTLTSLEHIQHVSRYPYLQNAILRRPIVYRSPYPRIESAMMNGLRNG